MWVVDGNETPAALKAGPNGILERPGILRLSVIGPAALMILSPQDATAATLTLEISVDASENALREIIGSFRKK